jgi:DNA-binding response OmpR family regulator
MPDNKMKLLIVDDEKNIRLTLTQTLESAEMEIDSAVNGEEALQKMESQDFRIILLDLKMPGMDGMEVLKKINETRPDIRVIIITAHGTIDSAVEAMKLGAVDFIQKPFAPEEIRSMVKSVIEREVLSDENANTYASYLELAKKAVTDRHFAAAKEFTGKAISIDNGRPEAMNLMGALYEIDNDFPEAQKFYRAALSLDPTYKPAKNNLSRTTSWSREGQIIIDTGKPEGEKQDSSDAKE